MEPGTAGSAAEAYRRHLARRLLFLGVLGLAVLGMLAVSMAVGAASLSLGQVLRSLLGLEVPRTVEVIVWNIRLPQSLACLVAGCGLALAGAVMQSILRNPLGSPFTLGVSHAAAFGAALSVMLLGGGMMTSRGAVVITNPWLTTGAAFACSLGASGLIIAMARLRGASPEVMVLTGVALGALCTAGTMLLQYFADDVQLAAMVFWTFGDAARASWRDCAVMGGITVLVFLYFMANSWHYNAIDAGDETAKGLGVRVERVRLLGMLAAALVTAVIISLLGVIGFVGLVAPHMVRRCIGADHRLLLPGAALAGGLLLLASDTVARLILAPHVLPVSVLTAFLGAPAFLLLILGRRGS